MPKISEERRAERREQILEGARRCFAENGYEGATVAKLEHTIGLMQILPETGEFIARSTGGTGFVEADLRDPDLNVRYGTWLLRYLLDRYDGDVETALAAYHAGAGNVDRWRATGTGIAFPETRDYVDAVTAVKKIYARAYGPSLGR
jgi:soluble lytic murein transglycosylase